MISDTFPLVGQWLALRPHRRLQKLADHVSDLEAQLSGLRAALSASEETHRRLQDEAAAARATAERLNAKIASGRELLEHGKAIVKDRDRCISQLEAKVKVKSVFMPCGIPMRKTHIR